MQITKLTGTVTTDTTLPTFESVFPSLVDPNKIILQDQFLTNSGTLAGRSIEKSDTQKTWSSLIGAVWNVNASGYASIATAAASRIAVDHKTTGKVYAAVEYGVAASYAGVVFRASDSSNLFAVSLSASLAGIYIQKLVAGANTQVALVPMTFTVGKVYHLAVEYTETGFVVYVDDVEKANITNSDLSTNIRVGLTTGSVDHKIWEFVAR